MAKNIRKAIMGISPIGFTPFTGNLGPLTRVTPFTHRDNATFLSILQELIQYVNTTLEGQVNSELQRILDTFQVEADGIDLTRTEWRAFFDQFILDVTANIATLNDMAIRDLINGKISDTYGALDTLFEEKLVPVFDALADEEAARVAAFTAQGDVNTGIAGRVTELERLYPSGPIDVVTIGDSYFSGYQPVPTPSITSIPETLVNIMNQQGLNEYRLHNYANNAGGYDTTWGGGDTYFNTQVTNAIADPAITNCRLIIVGGGRNDSGKDVYDEAVAIYTRLRTKWPEAKIVVFPMWSHEKFRREQRRTFSSIFKAAKDVGAVYDTNSLWVNTLTYDADWIDIVPHPKTPLVNKFAYALHSLIQGGSLPAQTTDLNVHSSSGITEGVATLDGFNVSFGFQQFVGAPFDASYILLTIPFPAMWPGNVNQYGVGYSGNGNNQTMYTISAETGQVFVTNTSGQTGLSGLNTSYPLGM